MKITEDAAKAIYHEAVTAYGGTITRNEALENIRSMHLMSAGSASIYLDSILQLLSGEKYTQTMNNMSIDYFLGQIYQSFGRQGLNKATTSLEQHIDYYNGLGNGQINGTLAILEKYRAILNSGAENFFPDEVPGGSSFTEGAVQQVLVNRYERDLKARKTCIDAYGCKCFTCAFDFETNYGDHGRDFIHVHHLRPMSKIGKEYVLDAIRDLRPLCPNCHAMIHRNRDGMLTIEQLKQILAERPSSFGQPAG